MRSAAEWSSKRISLATPLSMLHVKEFDDA